MRWVLAVVLLPMLAACRQDQAAGPPEAVPPLAGRAPAAVPVPVEAHSRAYQYRSAALPSPFEPSVAGLVAAADGRERQPLEQFRLAQLRMVGTLATGGMEHALVADPSGTIHRVAVGDYLGADNGRITAISRQAIALRETVRDGPGGQGEGVAWTSRTRTLALAVRAERPDESAATAQPTASEAEGNRPTTEARDDSASDE